MIESILDHIRSGSRLTDDQFATLYRHADLHRLGMMADGARRAKHPDKIVTYVIDRNINYTDVCISACKFCAFYRLPDSGDGYLIEKD